MVCMVRKTIYLILKNRLTASNNSVAESMKLAAHAIGGKGLGRNSCNLMLVK
jgi:hypothetical protein